mgnify:CR=1 FL=1
MTSLRSFIKRKMKKSSFITVVSGLPRSGTSMMMSALKNGGMPLMIDNIREADANNPKGYYEFEGVKKLSKMDNDWLDSAQGKAVKIISPLLTHLPDRYKYKIIFLERDMDEILASQRQMLERLNPTGVDNHPDDDLRRSYIEHLKDISSWMGDQDWLQTLYVSYNDVLQQPEVEIRKVAVFLENRVEPELMVQVVDPELYREIRK